MRITSVLVLYFLMGAVLWGGGVIVWENTGVGGLIISDVGPDGVETNTNTTADVESLGGPIKQAVGTIAGGGLIQAWNFFIMFIGSLFWPITITQSVNAPIEVVVLFGGLPTFSMLLGIGIIFRRGI